MPCSESVFPHNWSQGGERLGQGHFAHQPGAKTGIQVSCSPLGTLLGLRGLPGHGGVSCRSEGWSCKPSEGQGDPGLPQKTARGFLQRLI